MSLTVTITVTSTDPAIMAVAVGFLDVKSGASHDEMLLANRTKQVDLAGEHYLVRATLPTGELITEDLNLTGDGPHELQLMSGPQLPVLSPYPPTSSAQYNWLKRLRHWMGLGYQMGDVERWQPGRTRRPLAPPPALDVWLRRWNFADGAWVPGESVEPQFEPTLSATARTLFDIPDTGGRSAVQIGG